MRASCCVVWLVGTNGHCYLVHTNGTPSISKWEVACSSPYQSHSEEHDLEDPPDVGGADDVAVPNRRHGHHEEIDTLPITQVMHIGKVWKVARVLKL